MPLAATKTDRIVEGGACHMTPRTAYFPIPESPFSATHDLPLLRLSWPASKIKTSYHMQPGAHNTGPRYRLSPTPGLLPVLVPKQLFQPPLSFHLLLQSVSFCMKRKDSSPRRKDLKFNTPTLRLTVTHLHLSSGSQQQHPSLTSRADPSSTWALSYQNLCFLNQLIFLTPYSRLYSSLQSTYCSQAPP